MTVELLVQAIIPSKASKSGLLGQIFRIDEEKGPQFVGKISVPLADFGVPEMSMVKEIPYYEDGDYYMQLLMPNGDIITREFMIEHGKTTELKIELPRETPHEWLGLHTMTGKIRQDEGFFGVLQEEMKNYADLANYPREGFALDLLMHDRDVKESIFCTDHALTNLAKLIERDLDADSAIMSFGNFSHIMQPTIEDDDYALFVFQHSGILTEDENIRWKEQKTFDFGPGTEVSRNYLIQQSVDGGKLICLPTPWSTPYGQAVVELVLKKNSIVGSPDISMTIGDPMINTALGYINNGAIHKATELIDFKEAKRMLYEKTSYPLAAAVGGYLLVYGVNQRSNFSEADDWKNWVMNLDSWFEWLPDGAILHAALHFMLGEPDRDGSRDALMRAYERGLPFFTFGLKLLMDGMRYFAREKDDPAHLLACERLKILETIARRTDPSQPFLTVTFSTHWKNENSNTTGDGP